MVNIQKYFKTNYFKWIFLLSDSASTSYFFKFCILSADYFLSYAHPKGKHHWLSKNVAVRLGKRPDAWEQNRAIVLEPIVYPKVGSLQPPGHDIGHFSIIYKSNDPQIFHLHSNLWVYKLFMRVGACFVTIAGYTPQRCLGQTRHAPLHPPPPPPHPRVRTLNTKFAEKPKKYNILPTDPKL